MSATTYSEDRYVEPKYVWVDHLVTGDLGVTLADTEAQIAGDYQIPRIGTALHPGVLNVSAYPDVLLAAGQPGVRQLT